ncbi:MAG: gamma carbonic anhydrase family protein, partial [Crocinitomicaceae bacterium]|nr:gamma carbonic anhydrase family protein [Crocinitomicaceae bacterium]
NRHSCNIHGCEIKSNVLVGMGSIVMDNTTIEENVIVGAGSLVLENAHLEANSLYVGRPAKKVKELSKELSEGQIKRIADSYANTYSQWYKD